MAVTIRSQIRDALVAALGAMSPAGGYNLDWAGNGGAQHVQTVNDTKSVPTVIVSASEDDKGPENSAAYQATLSVRCVGIIDWPQEDAEFEVERPLDVAAGDIELCLLQQRKNDPMLGVVGVEDIRVERTEMLVDPDGYLVAVVFATVLYRHNTFDPTTYP